MQAISGSVGPNLPTDLDTASIGESDIENRHIRTGGRDPGQRFGHGGRFPHDLDVLARLEQRPKARPDDFMVVEEKHAQTSLGNPPNCLPPRQPISRHEGILPRATGSPSQRPRP